MSFLTVGGPQSNGNSCGRNKFLLQENGELKVSSHVTCILHYFDKLAQKSTEDASLDTPADIAKKRSKQVKCKKKFNLKQSRGV